VCAVVATAGSTNVGVVDDLAGVADVCADQGFWFHVDGAYGGAALAAPSVRHLFDGVDRADSFIVDPHKWLFAPYDCCALVYRDPLEARAAHQQHAEYLDVLQADDADWNASEFGFGLTRRARGLPFWFSLATHGTAAYTTAVEETIELTRLTVDLIRSSDLFELLMEPDLSVVIFRRLGWSAADYQAWSDRLLASGEAFAVPTKWNGETVMRFCFVNPRTTFDDVATVLATMAD
jgi:L-2,4-diaminobutyrate decarboxylase